MQKINGRLKQLVTADLNAFTEGRCNKRKVRDWSKSMGEAESRERVGHEVSSIVLEGIRAIYSYP